MTEPKATEDLESVKAERDAAVEALRYYARESNWTARTLTGAPKPVNALADRGERARKAIAKMGKPGEP